MYENIDHIPKKINEKPTVWLGLTMPEIVRTACIYFAASIIPCETLMLSISHKVMSIMFGLVLMIIITGVSTFITCKIMSKRKSGKPYGYSEQKYQILKARLHLTKIKRIIRHGAWINRRKFKG